MITQDPPGDGGELRGTLELSYVVHRGQEAIRLAIRERKIRAGKVGNTHFFNREQWAAAVEYYRQLDQRTEGKPGGERPE